MKGILSWLWNKGDKKVESPPAVFQLKVAVIDDVLREIFTLKLTGGEQPSAEERKKIDATIAVLKKHSGLIPFLFDFLSTKPTIEGFDGRVVSPIKKCGMYDNGDIGGSLEVSWDTNTLPGFSLDYRDTRIRGVLTGLTEEMLRTLELYVSHRGLRAGYAGPGPVMFEEELFGTEEEQVIARKIEHIMRHKVQHEEKILSIDEVIDRYQRDIGTRV